jgi:adenosylcobinamide-phosphate guanylyltransferase
MVIWNIGLKKCVDIKMVTAIIMAGGKGTRMVSRIEKPMIMVNDIPMISYVYDALDGAGHVNEIIIATSPHTPETEDYLRNKGFETFQTPGEGYVEDLQYLISKLYSNNPDEILLTVTADMPLLNSQIIDDTISKYLMCDKPAMCVGVSLDTFTELGLKPSIVMEDVVPSGLNILRSNNKKQDEEVLKLGKIELALNINSREDIVVVEELLRKFRLKI